MRLPVRLTFTLMLLVSLLYSVPGAIGQYRWHLAHTDQIDRFTYAPLAIGCWHNTCTVSVLIVDDSNIFNGGSRLVFYRTDDAGLTWTEQDPGLPPENGNTGILITKLQQIDSLHAIAVGDSELVVRTTDGGQNWQRLDFHNSGYKIVDVHFSSPQTGMIFSYGYNNNVFVTSDGGDHWMGINLRVLIPLNCYSYGGSKFQAVTYRGKLYSTDDNWTTMDSSDMHLSSIDTENEVVNACFFSGGDTLIAFGARERDSVISGTWGHGATIVALSSKNITLRSTDRGITWSKWVVEAPGILSAWNLKAMSRDTLLATGWGSNKFLVSTDRGNAWHVDSLLLDTAYGCNYALGLCMTSSGNPIAMFSPGYFPGEQGIIIRGELSSSKVEQPQIILSNTSFYPNPASGRLFVTSKTSLQPVLLEDLLGREVLRTTLSAEGTATLNVKGIPRGVYSMSVDHNGTRERVGNVVIGGEGR